MHRKIDESFLKKVFWTLFFIALIAQLTVFLNLSVTKIKSLPGDPKYYIKLVDEHKDEYFYPTQVDENSEFIWNPGFINFAILLKQLTGTHLSIIFLNIFCYLCSSLLIVEIGKILKNSNIGFISGIVYFLSLNFFFLTPFYITQTFFGTIFLVTTLLLLKSKYIFGGASIGILNWIRPLGIIFFVTSVFLYSFSGGTKFNRILKVSFGYLIIILSIGFVTKLSSGHFTYQATTGGLNLRMGAMPGANGGFKEEAYTVDGLKKNMSYVIKDKIRKQNGIDWIVKNKIEFVLLAPKKIISLISPDTYSFNSIAILIKPNKIIIAKKIIIALSLLYYFLFALLLFKGFISTMKQNRHYFFFVAGFTLFSIALTILTVGLGIYRHHLILICIPIVSIGIEQMISNNWLHDKKS